MNNILIISFVFSIAIFTHYNFFQFAINGDDILAIFRVEAYGANLSQIFSPYGGQNLTIWLLFNFFDLSSYGYMLTLFFLRLISAYFLFRLTLTLTKSRLASFFTSLYFIVSYAGIDTAEYAHLTSIYLGLSLMLFGFELLIKHYEKFLASTSKSSLLSALKISFVFFFALTIAAVRVSSLILIFLLIELILLIVQKSKIINTIFRLGIFFLFFLLLKILGTFGGDSPYHLNMILEGLQNSLGSLYSISNTVFNLTAFFFDILSPPSLDNLITGVLFEIKFVESIKNYLFIPLFLISFFGVNLNFLSIKKFKKVSMLFIFTYLIYLLIFRFTYTATISEISTHSLSRYEANFAFQYMNVIFGGFVLLLLLELVVFIVMIKKNLLLGLKFLVLVASPFLFVIVTYFFSPRSFYFETFKHYPIIAQQSYVHYFFMSSVVMTILIPYLLLVIIPAAFASYKNKTNTSIFILIILVTFNIISVRSFSKYRNEFRSTDVTERVYSLINSEIKNSYERNQKPIIYFKVDNTNEYYLYAVYEWGFAKFRYPVINNNYSIEPNIISNWEEFLLKADNSDIADLYAFEIKDNQVSSISEEIRSKLR